MAPGLLPQPTVDRASHYNEVEQEFFRRGEKLGDETPEDFSDLDDEPEKRSSSSESFIDRFVSAGTALIASLSRS